MKVFNLKQRLDELRRKDKIPYRKIADMIGVTENTLLSLCKHNDLKVSVLERIAGVFDMDLMQFIYDEGAHNEDLKKAEAELNEALRKLEKLQIERDLLARLVDSQQGQIDLMKKG